MNNVSGYDHHRNQHKRKDNFGGGNNVLKFLTKTRFGNKLPTSYPQLISITPNYTVN